MIDIESDVLTYVAKRLRAVYPKIFVAGEYIDVPASFPAVTIVEADNRVYERMRTTNVENAVQVMYEMNVYSNKVGGKKGEAKAITALADTAFAEIGFTRTLREQIPNLNDATIYRMVCRYEAVIDKDLWIYQT